MSKFKKIDKEYELTDSSLNVYKYRLLTSGYMLDEYKKNPIGYRMHLRDEGVAVRWEDFRIDGDKVFAKPVINLSHPKGQQILDEVENGFLNAASVGHIVCLEVSTNPADYLEGQTGPTVSKWFNRECSLVDIPGNYNSLSSLFDANDQPLNLADLTKTNFEKMKQVFLTAEQLGKLNLKADAADTASVDTALTNLVAEAAKVPQLVQDLADMTNKKKTAEDALERLKADTEAKEVDSILTQALNVDKKITKEVSDQLKAVYAKNPTGLKALIAAMPAHVSIAEHLKDKSKETADLAAKSWDELDRSGKLPDLKAKDFEAFKSKYKEKFGTEYKA
jgi:hypothetical protein